MATYDQYTKAVLHFDNEIVDDTGLTTWSNTGARIVTTNSRFGNGALKGGDGSYIVSNSAPLNFSGDFTVDFWFYADPVDAVGTLLTNGGSGGNFILSTHAAGLGGGVNGALQFWSGSNSGCIYTFKNVHDSFWHHCAWVRSVSLNKTFLFIDGIKVGEVAAGSSYYNAPRIFGHWGTEPTFGGLIDEVRFSIGIARWVSEFTPPTLPYGLIIKTLLQQGQDIKKYSSAAADWQIVGHAASLSEDMFNVYGMEDLALFNHSAFDKISGPFDLLALMKETNPSLKIAHISVPLPKLVFGKGDIELNSIDHINSITMTLTSVKTIVSVDKGVTWMSWDGTAWQVVDANDLVAVKSAAMTANVINVISKDSWWLLTGVPKTIRFAYYFDTNVPSDIANVDMLKMNVDLRGRWRSAINGTDYCTDYVDSTTVDVSIYASGNFKINY